MKTMRELRDLQTLGMWYMFESFHFDSSALTNRIILRISFFVNANYFTTQISIFFGGLYRCNPPGDCDLCSYSVPMEQCAQFLHWKPILVVCGGIIRCSHCLCLFYHSLLAHISGEESEGFALQLDLFNVWWLYIVLWYDSFCKYIWALGSSTDTYRHS